MIYYMLDECPICLEELDISNNIIITLECCKKHVHLDCIKQWSIDINNKNKNLCLLCRKNSNFLEDLYNNFTIQSTIDNSNSEIHYIQIDENNDSIDSYTNLNTLYSSSEKNILLNCIAFIYICINIIVLIILFYIITKIIF